MFTQIASGRGCSARDRRFGQYFGTTGTHPSHPELLDWLANELIQNHWSTKHLVRTIVPLDAYRRKVVAVPNEAADVDPDNRLYWGGFSRRLAAEGMRLHAAGQW